MGNLFLADFDGDVFLPVVRYEARVSKAVHKIFDDRVVWVEQFLAEADNPHSNAFCVFLLSAVLSQWLILNSRFSDGTGWNTTIFILIIPQFFRCPVWLIVMVP